MISIQKVLVPTDFSKHSEKAVRYGTELAEKFGADLHLLHAVELTPIIYGEGGGYRENVSELETAAVKKLDEVRVENSDEVQVFRKVITGAPFVEIVRYARDETIDLIVVGTHGRGAIAHMLLGSVAEKVVRQAPCPVLVMRDEEHDFILP